MGTNLWVHWGKYGIGEKNGIFVRPAGWWWMRHYMKTVAPSPNLADNGTLWEQCAATRDVGQVRADLSIWTAIAIGCIRFQDLPKTSSGLGASQKTWLLEQLKEGLKSLDFGLSWPSCARNHPGKLRQNTWTEHLLSFQKCMKRKLSFTCSSWVDCSSKRTEAVIKTIRWLRDGASEKRLIWAVGLAGQMCLQGMTYLWPKSPNKFLAKQPIGHFVTLLNLLYGGNKCWWKDEETLNEDWLVVQVLI